VPGGGVAFAMALDWTLAALIGLTALGAAVAGAAILGLWEARRRTARPRAFDPDELDHADHAVFLFEDERLVDASDAGRALLQGGPEGTGPWARLCTVLAPAFPDMTERLATLARDGRVELAAHDDPDLRLQAEWRRGVARITLRQNGSGDGAGPIDRLSLRALDDEVATLRAIVHGTPAPIWCERPDGAVIWANRAYLLQAVAQEGDAGALTWPLPRLFPGLLIGPEGTAPDEPVAAALAGADGRERHFEVHARARAGDLVLTAFPADAAVRARAAQRHLTQTLTQTFAQLPVGLAIFDRERRLRMFNPALADITGIGPDSLALRPSLEVFLDRLRDLKRIPEPRDYRVWRQGLVAIEAAAAGPGYAEVWTLPSGQVLRVTGRPHPDGAIAFLFEDISSEVSLSRRFRGEIETGRAVLDAMDEAVVVFSADGTLILTNAAYDRLWNSSPACRPGEIGVQAALRLWLDAALPNPLWHRLRRYVTGAESRVPLSTVVQMKDGRHLACRLAPLPGGATLIGFARPAGTVRPGATNGRAAEVVQPPPPARDMFGPGGDRADGGDAAAG